MGLVEFTNHYKWALLPIGLLGLLFFVDIVILQRRDVDGRRVLLITRLWRWMKQMCGVYWSS